jgi:RimK family alpha-L-glutamate ligase
MAIALIGSPTRTNVQLAYGWQRLGVDARVLWPSEAVDVLEPGDTALFRLDVLPTLDGLEPGLEVVPELERRGVRVLNHPAGLIATHDKLLTARLLEEAGLPHPRTIHVEPGRPLPDVTFPCVLKPRHGSWGQDVLLCRTPAELDRVLTLVRDRPWWTLHGAIVQELVGTAQRDVRVIVAGSEVAAGAERIAAPGEWRTNVTLGGTIVRAELPAAAADLARRAAAAIGIDFAGVDLLPDGQGWIVLELNGAVDFDARYTLVGVDPFASILKGLGIAAPALREAPPHETMAQRQASERMVDMAAKTMKGKPVQVGDEIEITGHAVGDSPRTAVVLEVLGEPGHERFHVRWEDDHESIFFPGEDAVVRRPTRGRAKPAA